MSEQSTATGGSGTGRMRRWLAIAAAVALFVGGVVVGATLLGDIGETPCYEVQSRAQPARDVLTDTFGSGEAGRAAAEQLLELAEANPGCFEPLEVDMLERQVDAPQTEATDQPSMEMSIEPSTSTDETG